MINKDNITFGSDSKLTVNFGNDLNIFVMNIFGIAVSLICFFSVPALHAQMETEPVQSSTKATIKNCKSHDDCDSCTEVCLSNKCVPSGNVRCKNDPTRCEDSERQCKCTPSCNKDRCQRCDQRYISYSCITLPNHRRCPGGTCVGAGEVCPEDCENGKGCEPCLEFCDRNKCVKWSSKKLCKDGTCIDTTFQQCPSACDPPCNPCTQVCQPKHHKGPCVSSGYKYCKDGRCIPRFDDCEPFKKKAGPGKTSSY